ALRRDGGFELANRFVQSAPQEGRHPELKADARVRRRVLERAAAFCDRAIVLTRRPVCDGEIHVGVERERVQLARVLGLGNGLLEAAAPDEGRGCGWLTLIGVGGELSSARELLVAVFPSPVEVVQD